MEQCRQLNCQITLDMFNSFYERRDAIKWKSARDVHIEELKAFKASYANNQKPLIPNYGFLLATRYAGQVIPSSKYAARSSLGLMADATSYRKFAGGPEVVQSGCPELGRVFATYTILEQMASNGPQFNTLGVSSDHFVIPEGLEIESLNGLYGIGH